MKQVVERDRNKTYYRLLHLPIWIWVFWVLPGHLTLDLYSRGPDRRHWFWLAVVTLGCAWRGLAGRLPGVERRPYVTYYGLDQPNLPYRVICYTAAWIVMLVPFALNLTGLILAGVSGEWRIHELYAWLYYPLALALVAATWFDRTPRARRSTRGEGAEKGWFYVALWTVVPAQLTGWAMWRLGPGLGFAGAELTRARLLEFLTVALAAFLMGVRGKLPRTERYSAPAQLSARFEVQRERND